MLLKRFRAIGAAASISSAIVVLGGAHPRRVLQGSAYEVEVARISLTDIDTQISDIQAVHNSK